MEDLALYIHWPWCLKKCPYCDFNSHVATKDETDAYTDALIADMQNQARMISKRQLVSIFFGGGTPSLMRPDQIKRILTASQALFTWKADIEITLESNPTSSGYDKFQAFKDVGINRLSIGVQSLHDEHLKFLGREHSSADAVQTAKTALSIFDNVNIDFIYGLPNQTLESWIKDLNIISELGTTHVSAYQLTIEPHTKFYGEVKKGKWQPLDDDTQADFFIETEKVLKSHNINGYEISNFSRNGYHCKHNFHIWQYRDYMGVGAGAHGRLKMLDNIRYSTQNFKMPARYIDPVERVKHSFFSLEALSIEEQTHEHALMSLRLYDGVQINEQLSSIINNQSLKKFLSSNLLQISDTHIKVTPKGRLLLDYLLSELFI